jgi:A/G-specific adenine glycosylase
MLQQTQVKTVLRYFPAWMRRFPTLRALAAADEGDVLHAWLGLGYYSRARRLQRAARAVVERHAGQLPRTREELLLLPGIGEYSAGAVSSIACGLPEPLVVGNVVRVLTRLFGLRGDPGRAPLKAGLWALARELVPPKRPGDFNQALMELGATVCLPRRPRCLLCPLASWCLSLARGTAEMRPVRAARRAAVRERRVVAVACRGDHLLLVRNASTAGLLAGLWEFPWTTRVAGGRRDWEAALGQAYGGSWRLGTRRGSARHSITFRALELDVHEAQVTFDEELVAESASGGEPGWLSR